MPKRSGKPPSDPNVAAFRVMARITGRSEELPVPKPAKKNPAAVALGRLGGKKGGAARARNLTPEQLAEIGRLGAEKRWGKKPKK
jgi:hypothetical protein